MQRKPCSSKKATETKSCNQTHDNATQVYQLLAPLLLFPKLKPLPPVLPLPHPPPPKLNEPCDCCCPKPPKPELAPVFQLEAPKPRPLPLLAPNRDTVDGAV